MYTREIAWSSLMQSGNAGDRDAYHRLLQEIAPVLRATTEREMAEMGMPPDRRESIVQQILLAVHLKPCRQFLPSSVYRRQPRVT